VAVERAERDLGARRDVAHLHRVVAAFGGQLGRGREQSLPSRRGLRGARARSVHGTGIRHRRIVNQS
jgi:hypothetical protein